MKIYTILRKFENSYLIKKKLRILKQNNKLRNMRVLKQIKTKTKNKKPNKEFKLRIQTKNSN